MEQNGADLSSRQLLEEHGANLINKMESIELSKKGKKNPVKTRIKIFNSNLKKMQKDCRNIN